MIGQWGRALAIAGCLFIIALDATAQATRISGVMQPLANIKQSSFQVSPNGQTAVFIADAETDGLDELYSVPVGGGTRAKLSIQNASGPVLSFKITPDSNRVIFIQQTATNPVVRYEMYSATIDGGSLVNLSGLIVNGGGGVFNAYQISPDGQRVVFYGQKDSANQTELYSVQTAGGSPVKLSGTLIANGQVRQDFQVTPNSQRVVFAATKDSLAYVELYSVQIASTVPIKLNSGNSGTGGPAFGFQVSADSQRVVYSSKQDSATTDELYSAQVGTALSSVKISGAMVANGNVIGNILITPDSSTVVFRADKTTDEVYELYSVPITGGTATTLSGTMVTGGDVFYSASASFYQLAPDGSKVVFMADRETDNVGELWSAPVAGGVAPTKLSGPLVANGQVTEFVISPNSQHVVFRADKDTDQVFELYTVPIGGGAAVKISGPMVANGTIQSGLFQVTPDSARVVFVADRETATVNELWFAFLAAGTPTRVSGNLVSGGDVFEFVFNPQGGGVVFRADKDTDNKLELYVTNSGGLIMDIDGNGVVDALTDGLLLLRWQFGLKGANLIQNAVAPNASRNTAPLIEAYLTKLDTWLGPN